MPTELPIIETCSGCGSCCLEQGSPPGMIGYLVPQCHAPEYIEDIDDRNWLLSAPPQARTILYRYIHDLMANRVTGEGPCVWFDHATRGCKFYEFRPNICRKFERGSEGCHSWREQYPPRENETDG